ncbi:MAG TPA: AMP-binding protein, partial [Myxococcaceae bacterium]|nr:AMP-binding protein [Myxococcaceae bacterium]
MAQWANEAPSRPALVFEGSTWTYRDLDREVSQWSAVLANRGVRRGARVGLLSNNRAELVALLHAGARQGAASVLLNARLTRDELRPLIDRVAPQLIIAEELLSAGLDGVESLERLDRERSRLVLPRREDAQVDPDAVLAILFTSGTSGAPRAAELTVSNFAASARASGLSLGSDPGQRWLACLPLFHVGGLAMLTRCAWYGACLILHRQFREDAVSEALQR